MDSGTSHHAKKASVSVCKEINIWHNRLSHASQNVLKSLPQHSKDVLQVEGDLQECRPCHLGKAKRKSFRSEFEKTEVPGEIVHSDLAGRLLKSIDGCEYIITFLDQYSRFTHVMGLKSKGEAPKALELYKDSIIVQKYFPKGCEDSMEEESTKGCKSVTCLRLQRTHLSIIHLLKESIAHC